MYDKVGESTEVALKVLAEKLNVEGVDKSNMSREELATACADSIYKEYKKVHIIHSS